MEILKFYYYDSALTLTATGGSLRSQQFFFQSVSVFLKEPTKITDLKSAFLNIKINYYSFNLFIQLIKSCYNCEGNCEL